MWRGTAPGRCLCRGNLGGSVASVKQNDERVVLAPSEVCRLGGNLHGRSRLPVPRCVTICKAFVVSITVRAAPRQVRQGQSHAAARHYLRAKSSCGRWGCRTALLRSWWGTVEALGTPAEPTWPLPNLPRTKVTGLGAVVVHRTLNGFRENRPNNALQRTRFARR